MHDIYYNQVSDSKLEVFLSCLPTLSFRTIQLDNRTHIKFGLPVFYGNMVRVFPLKEALFSMFVSDCLRNNCISSKIDFFIVEKCYYYNDHDDYSIIHRKKTDDGEVVPFGNYFNGILYFSEEPPINRFNNALDVVRDFILDLNGMEKSLGEYGVGLEIHGQNLLVYVNSDGISENRYLYRDFGQCTISNIFLDRYSVIVKHYFEENDFDVKKSNQIASPLRRQQKNIETMVKDYLLYNLNDFRNKERINIDVDTWMDDLLKSCDYLNKILNSQKS